MSSTQFTEHVYSLREQEGQSANLIQGSGSTFSPAAELLIREGHGYTGKSIQHAYIGEQLTLDVVLGEKPGSLESIYRYYYHNRRVSFQHATI